MAASKENKEQYALSALARRVGALRDDMTQLKQEVIKLQKAFVESQKK